MNALLTIHVALSLIEIAAGFAVVYALFSSQRLDGWTLAFLATGIATDATGFLLPAPHFLPSHAIGILSLVADKKLRPVVDRVLPLWNAPEAHRVLEERKAFGKVVLSVD